MFLCIKCLPWSYLVRYLLEGQRFFVKCYLSTRKIYKTGLISCLTYLPHSLNLSSLQTSFRQTSGFNISFGPSPVSSSRIELWTLVGVLHFCVSKVDFQFYLKQQYFLKIGTNYLSRIIKTFVFIISSVSQESGKNSPLWVLSFKKRRNLYGKDQMYHGISWYHNM